MGTGGRGIPTKVCNSARSAALFFARIPSLPPAKLFVALQPSGSFLIFMCCLEPTQFTQTHRPTLITYRKHNVSREWCSWSEWGESVRKIIEHIIGRLRGRFRILKLPLQTHSLEQGGHLVHTCCVSITAPPQNLPHAPPWHSRV